MCMYTPMYLYNIYEGKYFKYYIFYQVKMLSLIDLSSVMSPSSLPSNLKFPFTKSSASSGSSNVSPSRNKSPPKSNPPVAPPPRVDKPMMKQLSEPMIAQQKGENCACTFNKKYMYIVSIHVHVQCTRLCSMH